MRKIEFRIEFPGYVRAGTMPLSQTVLIELEREIPDHSFYQLTEALRDTLRRFYDGAHVMTKAEYDRLLESTREALDKPEQAQQECKCPCHFGGWDGAGTRKQPCDICDGSTKALNAEFRTAMRCTEKKTGKIGDFIHKGDFIAISPIFDNYGELLQWMLNNNFKTEEYTGGIFHPFRVIKY